jgi:hypothetical protein
VASFKKVSRIFFFRRHCFIFSPFVLIAIGYYYRGERYGGYRGDYGRGYGYGGYRECFSLISN